MTIYNWKQTKFKGRAKPYTQIGILRKKCCRCGKRAEFQWDICANNNYYVPICRKCDIALNKTVLKFMEFGNWDSLIKDYIHKLKVVGEEK